MPNQPTCGFERRPYTSIAALGTFSNITAGIRSVCFGPGCIRTNRVFGTTNVDFDDLF